MSRRALRAKSIVGLRRGIDIVLAELRQRDCYECLQVRRIHCQNVLRLLDCRRKVARIHCVERGIVASDVILRINSDRPLRFFERARHIAAVEVRERQIVQPGYVDRILLQKLRQFFDRTCIVVRQ